MHAIEIAGLVKRYGTTEAVRDVSLTVERGELVGLVGPDGAGKTTLLRAVCTLLAPDAGTILVQGHDATRDVFAVRQILGYMPQRFSLYPDLSVEQNLRFFADIFTITPAEREERLARLYRFSRLEPFKARKAHALSGGMKQKLALSCALIHTPEVLVLDEPTLGVDPVSRQEFWEILYSLRREGTALLVSTAYLDEADRCDRVALMHRGAFVALGTPAELKRGFRHPLYRVLGRDPRRLAAFLAALPDVRSTQLFGDAVHVSFARRPRAADWQAWQESSGQNLASWTVLAPSMEDVFLDVTG